MVVRARKRERHGIEHIFVVPNFPFPVLGEIHLKLRKPCYDHLSHFFLARAPVAADELLHRVWRKTQDFDSLPVSKMPYFIREDIEEGGPLA